MLRVGPKITESNHKLRRLCYALCTESVSVSVCGMHIRLSMKTLPQLLCGIVATVVFVSLAVNYVLAGASPGSFDINATATISIEQPELQQTLKETNLFRQSIQIPTATFGMINAIQYGSPAAPAAIALHGSKADYAEEWCQQPLASAVAAAGYRLLCLQLHGTSEVSRAAAAVEQQQESGSSILFGKAKNDGSSHFDDDMVEHALEEIVEKEASASSSTPRQQVGCMESILHYASREQTASTAPAQI